MHRHALFKLIGCCAVYTFNCTCICLFCCIWVVSLTIFEINNTNKPENCTVFFFSSIFHFDFPVYILITWYPVIWFSVALATRIYINWTSCHPGKSSFISINCDTTYQSGIVGQGGEQGQQGKNRWNFFYQFICIHYEMVPAGGIRAPLGTCSSSFCSKGVKKWIISCFLPCFSTFKMPFLMFISILVFRPDGQIWNPVRWDTKTYVPRILNASRISKNNWILAR